MKLYVMFIVFLISSLQSYEAEGIRMGKVLTLSATSNQEIIKISSVKRRDHDHDHDLVAKTDELTSGINRKLMTKTTSSTTISKNHKNEEHRKDPIPKNFQHEKDVANEPNPNDIDVVDYTPARNKSPIHN